MSLHSSREKTERYPCLGVTDIAPGWRPAGSKTDCMGDRSRTRRRVEVRTSACPIGTTPLDLFLRSRPAGMVCLIAAHLLRIAKYGDKARL
jgi:hypothetical protein